MRLRPLVPFVLSTGFLYCPLQLGQPPLFQELKSGTHAVSIASYG